MRTLTAMVLLVGLLQSSPANAASDPFHEIRELNYYEWTAVAPIVISGQSIGEVGKLLEFRVDHVLRGDLEPGATIWLELKRANRERRRSDYPQTLKMPPEIDFLVVLDGPLENRDGTIVYPLARSVLSARELPLESQQGVLDAVSEFIRIQDAKNDLVTWRRMGAMLEETNPLILVTALEQLFKFRRGTQEHLFSLRPLFDHPVASIREGAAKVVGQIIERNLSRGETVPEEEALLAELIGVARRDDTIETRVAATNALASFGVGRVEVVLDEIARSDPDQNVRYSAERVLLQYRKAQEEEARRPRLQQASH